MSIRDRTCNLCKKVFSSKQMANLHVKNKVCEKRAKLFCQFCNKKFKNKRAAQRHAKNNKLCLVKSCDYDVRDVFKNIYENSNSVNLNYENASSKNEELLIKMSKKNSKKDIFLLNNLKKDTILLNNIDTLAEKQNDIYSTPMINILESIYSIETIDSTDPATQCMNINLNNIETSMNCSLQPTPKKTKKT
jgi:hypothetical protein